MTLVKRLIENTPLENRWLWKCYKNTYSWKKDQPIEEVSIVDKPIRHLFKEGFPPFTKSETSVHWRQTYSSSI